MKAQDFKPTACYAVVHYGTPDISCTLPHFLLDPKKGTKGKFCNPYDVDRAAIFQSKERAKAALKEEDEYLRSIGHKLAGHLSIVEFYTKKVD